MNAILNGMETQAKRAMLNWHCGREMFCRGCQRVLDSQRAVELDCYKGEELLRSKIMCAGCYDDRIKALVERMRVEHPELLFVVTDGRELFAKRKRQPSRRQREMVSPVPVLAR